MLNTSTLQDAFSGLVGFFQYYNPDYVQLDDELSNSESGLYAQTTHPLCSIENVINSAPDFKNFVYPDFVAQDIYDIGNIVVMQSDLFIKTETGWQPFKPFNKWVKDLYNSAVIELIQDIVRIKRMSETTKQLIDSLRLFDGLGMMSDRVLNEDKFVGLELIINKQEGLGITIDQIGLQLDSAPLDMNLYLLNANDYNIKKTIPCSFARSGNFAWVKIKDLILNYLDEQDSSNGVFWLGYYQRDLGIKQAINRNTTSWNSAPCVSCSEWNAIAFKKWSRHVGIRSVALSTDNNRVISGPPQYSYIHNYGLNLALTVGCDLTNMFIKNKYLLANGLALKLSLKLLSEIAFTTRINVVSDITKKLAMAELSLKDTDSFINKYNNELKAINFDFSGLSTDCLPCTNKKVIEYGSI